MWEKGQIVLISNHYPNGKKTRTVGIIQFIHEDGVDSKGRQYVTLRPLPEFLAAPVRDKYCTKDYNHQGVENCYSDRYGFACRHLHPDTTVIIGKYEVGKEGGI